MSTIAVKIECPCGQRYEFEAEPVAGQMAVPVFCPTCGADGTAAANEFIAQRTPSASTPEAVPSSSAAQMIAGAPRPRSVPVRPLLSDDTTRDLIEAKLDIK